MIKETIAKSKKKLPKSTSLLLIGVGIVGLLLLLLSSFGKKSSGTKAADNNSSALNKVTAYTYADNAEKKLEMIISDMLGSTNVKVMITLETGVEYVYASETKTDADVKNDRSSLKTEQSDRNELSHVIIKDSDGNEEALVVTEKMPVVRGVVIVCNNGQTEAVSAAVRYAVKSALNIDEKKICVIGRHN